MELLLNLIWLAVAVSALAAWRIRNRDHSRAELLREGVALLCVLVLLFFVISMTDDLHQEATLSEDSTLTRRQIARVAMPHPPPSPAHFVHHPALARCAACVLDSAQPSAPIVAASFIIPASRTSGVISGRSPPQLSI
jgi:hypothetical protein